MTEGQWTRCTVEVRGSVCGRHPLDPVHLNGRPDIPWAHHDYLPEGWEEDDDNG